MYDFLETQCTWHAFWDATSWNGRPWCFGFFEGTDKIAPALLAFWFIRNLILLVLISPLIYYLVKGMGKWLLVILSFCYLSDIWIQYQPFSIEGILFFCIGAYLSINKYNLVSYILRYRKYCITLVIPSFIVALYSKVTGHTQLLSIALPWYVLFGVGTAICIAAHLVTKGKGTIVKSLAPTGFFIYATHMIFIYTMCRVALNKILCILLPAESIILKHIHYILAPITTVLVCVIVFYTLKRFTSKLLGVLTGSRL